MTFFTSHLHSELSRAQQPRVTGAPLREKKATIIVVFLARSVSPVGGDLMITGRQIRAARALLHWKQEMLAEKALVALTALKRLESERGLGVHESTRDQVRRALEKSGVIFIDTDQGHGVMLQRKTAIRRGVRATRPRN